MQLKDAAPASQSAGWQILEVAARKVARTVRRTTAHLRNPGRMDLGAGNVVGSGLNIARGARLVTGANVGIGTNVMVMANVEIGEDCLISSSVAFIGNDHPFDEPETLIRNNPSNPFASIVLEGDNLVGYGVIIVGSVRIGYGAVIGAGSLVTSDLPPMSVCVGRPARPIRHRGERIDVVD